jgi:hypothetical protein
MQASFYLWQSFLFVCSATCCSICEGEWHMPRILRAWNRRSDPGTEPGTYKKSCCEVRGSNPGPTKHRVHKELEQYAKRTQDFHVECICQMTDNSQTNGQWKTARPIECSWSWKFILRVCGTYTTLLMSLVKDIPGVCRTLHDFLSIFSQDIPGVCRTLHNSLNVISENIPGACRTLHTFIFHSRQNWIIFNSILSS